MNQITDQSEPNPRNRIAASDHSVQPFHTYSSRPGTAHNPMRSTTRQLNAARCNIARATRTAANGASTQNVGNSVTPTPYSSPRPYRNPLRPVR